MTKRIGKPCYSLTAEDDPEPWWMVDLSKEEIIGRIVILRRLEDTNPGRLQIKVLDKNDKTVFKTGLVISDRPEEPEAYIVDFDKVSARYIRIEKQGSPLALAEALVFK